MTNMTMSERVSYGSFKERSEALDHYKDTLEEMKDKFSEEQYKVLSAIYDTWLNLHVQTIMTEGDIHEVYEKYNKTINKKIGEATDKFMAGQMSREDYDKILDFYKPETEACFNKMDELTDKFRNDVDTFWAFRDKMEDAIKNGGKGSKTTAVATVKKVYNSAEELYADKLSDYMAQGYDFDDAHLMAAADAEKEFGDKTAAEEEVKEDIKAEAEKDIKAETETKVAAEEPVIAKDIKVEAKEEPKVFSFSAIIDKYIIRKKEVKTATKEETVKEVTSEETEAVKTTVEETVIAAATVKETAEEEVKTETAAITTDKVSRVAMARELLAKFLGKATEKATTVVEAAHKVVTKAVDTAISVVGTIKETTATVLKKVCDKANTVGKVVVSTISSVAETVVTTFEGIMAKFSLRLSPTVATATA